MRAVIAAIILAGCGAIDEQATFDPVRRDSAGITIVENPAAAAERETGWRVDSVPDLDIGADQSDSTQQLFRISGIRQLADGRVVVVNGLTQLRFYDGEALVQTVGREGDGPGEFRVAQLVRSYDADSIVIQDVSQGRFAIFDRAGSFGRTVSTAQGGAQPVGLTAGGRLLTTRSTARANFDSPEALLGNDVILEVGSLDDATRDTIAVVPGQTVFLANQNGVLSFTPVPLDQRPSAAVTANGFVYTTGKEHEIRILDDTGAVRTIARIDRPVVAVTSERFAQTIEATMQGIPASFAAEMRRRFDRMSPPPAAPVFTTLLVDSGGCIWAQEHDDAADAPQRWIVFDSSGAVLGRVTTPAGMQIHDIGDTWILGRWRDALDVEHVRRHRLTR